MLIVKRIWTYFTWNLRYINSLSLSLLSLMAFTVISQWLPSVGKSKSECFRTSDLHQRDLIWLILPRIEMNQGHVFNTNLRSFVRLTFRLGNFSLNCSFRSFFSSDGLAYAMTDTYKRKMTIPNQQSIPLNKVVQQKLVRSTNMLPPTVCSVR